MTRAALHAWLGLAVVVATLASGCSKGPLCSVTGQVTLDGQPLESGSIVFVPLDSSEGATGSATISNGEYAIPVDREMFAGKHRVAITATKPTGRQVKAFDSANRMIPEIVQYIPKRYNEQSELTAELAPGDNKHDFKLERDR